MRLGNIVLIHPIEIMVRTVMVGVITPKVSVSVHIPCGVIVIRVKTIADIAAWDFLIAHASAIPEPQIGNNQNGLRKLDVQIEAFVLKVVPIFLIHHGDALVLGKRRIFFLHPVLPLLIVKVSIGPDAIIVLTHRASPLSFGITGFPSAS